MVPARLRAANTLAGLLCVLFAICGMLWISEIGIQADEALFGAGIYPPFGHQNILRAFRHDVPLMVMSYVGTVKSWLYSAIFLIWQPSAASIRIPAILIGAITVWLFYRLLLRTLGLRAAIAGCALLATDTMFLLTVRWDWGPVAIQHFCLVGAMLALVNFYRQRSIPWLTVGFFLLGVGMWDKAVFIWSLAGLFAATLVVFRRELLSLLTIRRTLVAAAAFLIGSMPLIIYNERNGFITFRGNAAWSSELFEQKAKLLKDTWEGASLFGAVVREEWDGPVKQMREPGKRALVLFNRAVGYPRRNLLLYGLILALLLLPLVWRTQAARASMFAAIFTVITFLLMAFTKGAGTGTHHAILIWPVPHILLAAVFAECSRRWRWGTAGLVLVVGGLSLSNVLLTTSYYANMLRNGGVAVWTDAFYPLSETIGVLRPKRLCVLDWGFYENLRLLHRGGLNLCNVPEPSESEGTYFVSHTAGNEIEPGAVQAFSAEAARAGYKKAGQQTFWDSNGRPMIELFRLEKLPLRSGN